MIQLDLYKRDMMILDDVNNRIDNYFFDHLILMLHKVQDSVARENRI